MSILVSFGGGLLFGIIFGMRVGPDGQGLFAVFQLGKQGQGFALKLGLMFSSHRRSSVPTILC